MSLREKIMDALNESSKPVTVAQITDLIRKKSSLDLQQEKGIPSILKQIYYEGILEIEVKPLSAEKNKNTYYRLIAAN